MGAIYRTSQIGDEPGLKYLWQTVFGDSDKYIDAFFENMYTPGCANICEINGSIVSAAYLLELGTLTGPAVRAVPATVLYAFATLPEWRGKGIGGKVCDMLLCRSAKTARTVCPAEDSLFGYYKSRYGYEPYFGMHEKRLAASEKPIKIDSVSPSVYGSKREKLLSGRTHILYNEKALRYQKLLCKNAGGDLVYFDGGCAAYEISDSVIVFKEILSCGSPETAASGIAAYLGMENVVLRAPCSADHSDTRPFAMLMQGSDAASEVLAPWYGFAFD